MEPSGLTGERSIKRMMGEGFWGSRGGKEVEPYSSTENAHNICSNIPTLETQHHENDEENIETDVYASAHAEDHPIV